MIEQALAANGVQDTAAVIAEVDRRLSVGELEQNEPARVCRGLPAAPGRTAKSAHPKIGALDTQLQKEELFCQRILPSQEQLLLLFGKCDICRDE
jgi:hypothetical protein